MMAEISGALAREDEKEKASVLGKRVKAKMATLRAAADELETMVPDALWKLPKFWEMLFLS